LYFAGSVSPSEGQLKEKDYRMTEMVESCLEKDHRIIELEEENKDLMDTIHVSVYLDT
jgi:hypothetical protein